MRGKNFNNGSLQAGCVKFYISCTCIITVSKYAHFLCVFTGGKVG